MNGIRKWTVFLTWSHELTTKCLFFLSFKTYCSGHEKLHLFHLCLRGQTLSYFALSIIKETQSPKENIPNYIVYEETLCKVEVLI